MAFNANFKLLALMTISVMGPLTVLMHHNPLVTKLMARAPVPIGALRISARDGKRGLGFRALGFRARFGV